MNWFRKHWIAILSSIVAVTVAATSLTVLLWPTDPKPLDVYMLRFDGNTADSKNKNKFIDDSLNKFKKVLSQYDEYHQKTYGTPFESLTFQYTNLKSSQSDGDKNYFNALNRTLKEIDPRLGINNIQRTPESVNEGFYNKNTELLSFYWSPDYNGVGTWLKYMFSDSFSLANFWPAVHRVIEKNSEPWAQSLGQELKKVTFDGKQSIFLNHDELLGWLNSSANTSKISVSDAYVTIANVIGRWVKDNSSIGVELAGEGVEKEFVRYDNNAIGLGIQFVNYIASNMPTVPFVEDGPWTSSPWLVRDGFYNQVNPNADYSFRDWFYEPEINNNSKLRFWLAANPFTTNKTPFNPAFSNAASSIFFQSAWASLTSWTTIGDENSKQLPYQGSHLVTAGATNTIEELINEFNSPANTFTFKIRPIPWVNNEGKQIYYENKPMFLSPEDFRASVKAYVRSIDCGLNSNDYFVSLLGIDIEKTLNDPNNSLRNENNNEYKEFKVYFNNPTLSAADCLDILQKQYFNAIPAFKQSVKNIINDEDWKNSANLTSSGALNTTTTRMENFYGSGDWRKSWNDWAYAGPYYIKNITEQNLVFAINNAYFDSFSDVNKQQQYISFNKTYTTPENKEIKKFEIIDLKYAGSYNENILFEQFKSNELDVSPIQSANIVSVSHNFPNDLYYKNTKKLNKSDLITYNLQVYERNAQNIILDTNNKPMADANGKPTYTVDEYGNLDFKGQTPKLKSKVSKEFADLIVKDYFTPIEKGGVSQLFRTVISNCINWVSLQTLVFPGITKSIQYSFMPFGVYDLDMKLNVPNYVGNVINNSYPKTFAKVNIENIGKYWYYASSKKYMTQEQLSTWNLENYRLRKTGSIIWTYDELLGAMIH